LNHKPGTSFAYDEAITARHPTIRAGVIHATGLSNGPSPPELLNEYRAEQRAASERKNATAKADLSQVAAWRRAFSRFGAKPTQYRNAAEALLRRLAKHGDILTINTALLPNCKRRGTQISCSTLGERRRPVRIGEVLAIVLD
jgi:DNA/RNA-binding domain of Phe-tRNA-synthetase-like protein